MAEIAKLTRATIAKASGYAPASGDLRALIAAKREGYLWRSDLTPDRISAVRHQLAMAEAAAKPPPFEGIKTWLAKLATLVSNAPVPSGEICAVFAEVCSDIPDGAWTPATRIAWTRQADRNGYPIGSRWPAPGELYAHLRPYAEQIRSEVTGLREILAMAEKPSEPERKRPDAKEMARAGALADAVIRELRATGEGMAL
ncbi:hypothetical protein [Gluconobacter kanchanaburiensis]|uniref:Uncharacterized protein n=1 Tax=Gluconobacter kanchanaburiensis NBRC 103587 TaxID=1307948 RepID=A0A511B6D6_9PROT|nr:hypothetical protein [Gluconobacter kanchanaburiensis]MBF0861261.1 hypothetical protein [Gluconobacter kanchanaburiensis]GBR70966.1 hypothetical protein AA103587_2149 [Gluconobacter kanchanaburiensis NBRC 103587]GEK95914.1 hypothetical protein GKA01_11110 [Gluconobacter kanchanaburiensis NBRC 103587]